MPESVLEQTGYHNGVTFRNTDSPELIDKLPSRVGIPGSLLSFPCYVLHEKVAKKERQISVNVSGGAFNYTRVRDDVGFPTIKHMYYLLLLLGKFATQYNKEGILYFKYAEILKLAGMKKSSSNSIAAIKETIRRFMFCSADWTNTMVKDREEVWSGPFITECSIYNVEGDEQSNNPRNSKNKSNWHKIVFSDQIRKLMGNGHTRLYFTKIFQLGLKTSELVVLNYFWAFGDSKGYWHSIYGNEKDTGLIEQFNWTGEKRKFLPWLEDNLKTLIDKNFFADIYFRKDKKALYARLKELRPDEIGTKQEGVTVLVSDEFEPVGMKQVSKKMSSRRGTNKMSPFKYAIEKLPNEKVLEEYYTRKSKGLIDEMSSSIIDHMIDIRAIDQAVRFIKEQLVKH